ncbi:transporter substrate-binding domain-containing protein [Virgibacillus halophilus]|uniref:transporter substrate-binding domain-containing protein n=1 Tax=Tigheibacillus halophilus TaxID=361280 RepID=UPI003629C455
MKKTVIFLLVVIVAMLSACSGNSDNKADGANQKKDPLWEKIKDKGVIVAGTDGTLYPASYYPEDSDKLTGYNVEIFRELAKRLGVKVKFEVMPFDSMLGALSSGRVDMIQAGPRGESKKKFTYSTPVKYSYATMIVRKKDHSGIEKMTDLKGKKAGGAATTVYSEIAKKYGAKVVTYGNVANDAYLRDVDNGRTDVVINDYYLQRLALAALPQFDLEIHPNLKFYPNTNNVVIQKDAPVLEKKVNKAIADMQEDGTLTKLSKKFFSGDDVSKEPDLPEMIDMEGIE